MAGAGAKHCCPGLAVLVYECNSFFSAKRTNNVFEKAVAQVTDINHFFTPDKL